MTIPKLVAVAGAALLILSLVALPVSAAGNQYKGSRDCPNCPDDCTPKYHDYHSPRPHGQGGIVNVEATLTTNGEPIQNQFQYRYRYSTGTAV